jgi:hypothetical protein
LLNFNDNAIKTELLEKFLYPKRSYFIRQYKINIKNSASIPNLFVFKMATTQYYCAPKIYGAELPRNKEILCRDFTMKQHWTVFLREAK